MEATVAKKKKKVEKKKESKKSTKEKVKKDKKKKDKGKKKNKWVIPFRTNSLEFVAEMGGYHNSI